MITQFLIICLLAKLGSADPISVKDQGLSPLDECLKKDSISCVQIQVFRNIRSFFNQGSVDLFGGLSLVKNPVPEDESSRKISEDVSSESQILSAGDFEKREDILESFTLSKAGNFFQERSLSWNLSPVVTEVADTARGLVNSIPVDVKNQISDFITEGRGKKKKLLKSLLPLLIGLKVKLAGMMGLAYIIIALIAKKAIFASLISLAISGFIAARKLMGQQSHHPHHEVVHPVEYSSHGSGFSGPAVGGGYSSGGWESYGGGHGDSHGSYSSNNAHSLAYSGQKPVRR